MSEVTVASIPVHAESPAKWLQARDATVGRVALQSGASHSGDALSNHVLEVRDRVFNEWGGWRFNRVVGWLCVVADGGVLRVDVYRHACKRFTLQAALQDAVDDYRAEVWNPCHFPTQDVAGWLFGVLQELAKRRLPRRWVDWRSVQVLIGAIDWKRALEHAGGRHSFRG